jgi:repressor LexA
MSFSKRLQEARLKSGLTLDEVGRKVGKSKSTIQRYESGHVSKLDNEMISALAKAVRVNPVYLMGWSDVNAINTVDIPVLGVIACGDPITANENVVDVHTRIAEDLPSGDLFYLTAKGDSMSPAIESGALVLCRQQPDVENGEIAAVLVNGNTEATLKKVRKIKDSILLEPINEDYEPYIVTESNPATIIGKAVEVTNKL